MHIHLEATEPRPALNITIYGAPEQIITYLTNICVTLSITIAGMHIYNDYVRISMLCRTNDNNPLEKAASALSAKFQIERVQP